MSSLMIRCPKTGLDVGTGVDTDLDSLGKLPDTFYYTPCPQLLCGNDARHNVFPSRWLRA
jgi:hypothetical protein